MLPHIRVREILRRLPWAVMHKRVTEGRYFAIDVTYHRLQLFIRSMLKLPPQHRLVEGTSSWQLFQTSCNVNRPCMFLLAQVLLLSEVILLNSLRSRVPPSLFPATSTISLFCISVITSRVITVTTTMITIS